MDWVKELNYTLDDFIKERGDPNGPDLDGEHVLVYLSMGKRIPQNDYENRLLDEIQDIRRKGLMLEIPSNGI